MFLSRNVSLRLWRAFKPISKHSFVFTTIKYPKRFYSQENNVNTNGATMNKESTMEELTVEPTNISKTTVESTNHEGTTIETKNHEETMVESTKIEEPNVMEELKPPTVDLNESTEVITESTSFIDKFLDAISPVGWLETGLHHLHDLTGAPWWAVIAGFAIVVRMLMFPIYVISTKNNLKMVKIQPELKALQAKILINRSRGTREGMEAANHYMRRMNDIMKREGCKTWKSLLPAVQFPFFITFFITLRRMAANVESFQWGGLFWFTDLTIADQYWILPIISGVFVLLSLELGNRIRLGAAPVTGFQNKILWGSRIFTFLIIPFTASFPAALFMYWIPSNIWNLIQQSIINTPYIRKKFDIPEITPPDLNIANIARKQTLWQKIKRKFKGEKPSQQKLLSYQELMELRKKKNK